MKFSTRLPVATHILLCIVLLVGCVITTWIGGDAIWFAMLIAEVQTAVCAAWVMRREFGGRTKNN